MPNPRPVQERVRGGNGCDAARMARLGWWAVVPRLALAGWQAFERDWLGGEDAGRHADSHASPDVGSRGSSSDPLADAKRAAAWCRRCGGTIGRGEASSPCVACRGRSGIADEVLRLGEFSGDLRRRVLELKYGGRPELAEGLGRDLAEVIAGEGRIDVAATLVIAVPGASWRVWHRGVDHAAELGREVARRLQVPNPKVLAHLGTPPRSGSSAPDRRRRTLRRRGAWGRGSLGGTRVLLVDDVLTTGATLREAVRCLRPLGPAKISACVVAFAPDWRRPATPSVGDPIKNIVTNP